MEAFEKSMDAAKEVARAVLKDITGTSSVLSRFFTISTFPPLFFESLKTSCPANIV